MVGRDQLARQKSKVCQLAWRGNTPFPIIIWILVVFLVVVVVVVVVVVCRC